MSDLTSKKILPPLPKNDHAFCDPEGEEPDILVWRDYSMRAYAATAVADHQAEIDRLALRNAELVKANIELAALLREQPSEAREPLVTGSGLCLTEGHGCWQVSDQVGGVVEIPFDEAKAVARWLLNAEEPQQPSEPGVCRPRQPCDGLVEVAEDAVHVVLQCPRCGGCVNVQKERIHPVTKGETHGNS